MATLPGAWRYRIATRTGWPGVSALWLSEIASLFCYFYLSLAAHKKIWADPSLRYALQAAVTLSKQETTIKIWCQDRCSTLFGDSVGHARRVECSFAYSCVPNWCSLQQNTMLFMTEHFLCLRLHYDCIKIISTHTHLNFLYPGCSVFLPVPTYNMNPTKQIWSGRKALTVCTDQISVCQQSVSAHL